MDRSSGYLQSMLLLCGLLLYSIGGSAQIVVSGRVTDEKEQPLSGANVYINGSTAGTTSAADGSFSFSVGKSGFVEIVASFVGYEPLLLRTELAPPGRRITFRLAPKEQVLRNVLVMTSAQRAKWLAVFRENFLGITSAGQSCRILNEDAIAFESIAGGIGAYSDEPLVILNRELGYRISFDLVAFTHAQDRSSFYGYSRYEELSDRTARSKARIRRRYYTGSTMHFFRSLVNGSLAADGFSLRLLRPLAPDSSKLKSGPVQVRKAAQMMVSLPVVADSLVGRVPGSNPEQYLLRWDGRLQVGFDKDPISKAALQRRVLMMGNQPKGVVSYIDLQEGSVAVDGNGMLAAPMAVSFGGFWVYEKLGNMLPADYQPQ